MDRDARPIRFPVIVGPTAGGKSALGVEVALEFSRRGLGPGEVVSCDSVQVYRGLDIGSAKPTEGERRGVPHHLIDVAEPTERFSVRRWLELAEGAIREIQGRGGVPVVVGGTHLYIKAFLEGLFEGPEPDPALRAELAGMDPGARRAELERVDPDAAARIHPNDERRTIRALEVYRMTGRPISELQTQWDGGSAPSPPGGVVGGPHDAPRWHAAGRRTGRPDCVLVGLEWPTGSINRRINARVKAMVEAGLVEEARGLWEAGRLGPTAGEALGYKQLVEHFEGGGTLEEAVERIKIETRRFAKNQRTWLRRLRATPGALWIDVSSIDPGEWAGMVVQRCLGTNPLQNPG